MWLNNFLLCKLYQHQIYFRIAIMSSSYSSFLVLAVYLYIFFAGPGVPTFSDPHTSCCTTRQPVPTCFTIRFCCTTHLCCTTHNWCTTDCCTACIGTSCNKSWAYSYQGIIDNIRKEFLFLNFLIQFFMQ